MRAERTSLVRRMRAALGAVRVDPPAEVTADSRADTVTMLGETGVALLAASQATSDVEHTLRILAERYGRPELRIFVLPTLILIETPDGASSQTAIFPADAAALRLDQCGAVDHMVRVAVRDRTAPADVMARIDEIRAGKPRFGPVVSVFGHTLLTVGFGLVLNPTVTALPVYAVLGAIVGCIVLLGNRLPTLSLILPVLTSFTVTLLISLAVRPLVHDDVLRLVAPSLVSFLPGLTLTIAAVELTTGQVIAGASRLVYGFARLGLLAFGVFAGISVAGPPPAATSDPAQLGWWAPWVGLLLVSLGYYLYSSAPKRSLPWILFALVVAYGAQLAGNLAIGAELSGLVGALIVIPVVTLASRVRVAPPPAIMLTCAYWLLVPGSLGFIGFSEIASGAAGASETLLRTLGSLIAISIGMVLGAGLSRDAGAMYRGWRGATKP